MGCIMRRRTFTNLVCDGQDNHIFATWKVNNNDSNTSTTTAQQQVLHNYDYNDSNVATASTTNNRQNVTVYNTCPRTIAGADMS